MLAQQLCHAPVRLPEYGCGTHSYQTDVAKPILTQRGDMLDLTEALKTMAAGFSIGPPIPTENPLWMGFSLVPPPALQWVSSTTKVGGTPVTVSRPVILEPVTTFDVIQGDISLSWLTKGLRFQQEAITDKSVYGGIPILDLLSVPALNPQNVVEGLTKPAGVPGQIAALTGKVPILTPITKNLVHTVDIEVRWHVLNESGGLVPFADVSWIVKFAALPPIVDLTGDGAEVKESPWLGSDVTSDVLNLRFKELPAVIGQVVERTGTMGSGQIAGPPHQVNRSLSADVRLSVTVPDPTDPTKTIRVSTGWIQLVPVPIALQVPTFSIPVPTILVLFDGSGFSGRALLLAPSSSPFALGGESAPTNLTGPADAPIKTALTALAALSLVIGTGGTSPFPLLLSTIAGAGGIPGFGTLLDTSTFIWGVQADSISSFFNMQYTGIFQTAEDMASSFILFGPPGRRVDLCNARNSSDDEGRISVTIGPELVVTCTALTASPPSLPPNRIKVEVPPKGQRDFFHNIVSFNDELSSSKFSFG
jgi:hypothetical protein